MKDHGSYSHWKHGGGSTNSVVGKLVYTKRDDKKNPKNWIDEFDKTCIGCNKLELYWFKVSPSLVAGVKKSSTIQEFKTEEGCYIAEISNDKGDNLVSIARARVRPGVSTAWHKLNGITERYIIISGAGSMEIGDLDPIDVCEGDVVRIPANTPQRIRNIGELDLLFYCICVPPYRTESYVDLE